MQKKTKLQGGANKRILNSGEWQKEQRLLRTHTQSCGYLPSTAKQKIITIDLLKNYRLRFVDMGIRERRARFEDKLPAKTSDRGMFQIKTV